jgi:hypothetical protein
VNCELRERQMHSPDDDQDDLDQVFQTFRDDPDRGDNASALVPAPCAPTPNVDGSAIALPEPDAEIG